MQPQVFRALLLLAVACMLGARASSSSSSSSQVIYAGFNHVLAIDSRQIAATAFDYRKGLAPQSSCDVFAHPPLLSDVKLTDWIAEGVRASASAHAIVVTYTGYQTFVEVNTYTGAYAVRRCRDFRPQLTVLPCEVYATGTNVALQAPTQLIFLGGSRVMLLNAFTGAYDVRTFDVDVHTGGDPFHMSQGPLFSGNMPSIMLTSGTFAHVQLADHKGDLLLMHHGEIGHVTGFSFNGAALTEQEFGLTPAFEFKTGFVEGLTSLGDNQVAAYDADLNLEIWEIVVNSTHGAHPRHLRTRSLTKGHHCAYDSATSCVLGDGCAWCTSTKTCHEYDDASSKFCDSHACDAVVVDHAAAEAIENREADWMEPSHIIVEQQPVVPLLNTTQRLPDEYRNELGMHANELASPIHPAIDNELGDQVIKVADNMEDLIHETNRVSKGLVFTPPPPGSSSALMDVAYDPAHSLDTQVVAAGVEKMNKELSEDTKVYVTSPVGEHEPAPLNVLAPQDKTAVRLAGPNGDFLPRKGDVPPAGEVYAPAATVSVHEHDIMNEIKSVFSDLHAHGSDQAIASPTLEARQLEDALPDEGSQDYRPKEPVAHKPPRPFAPSPLAIRATPDKKTQTELMDEGLSFGKGLAGSLAADGVSAPLAAAMTNSESAGKMPKSIDEQLSLFAHEDKNVKDTMPSELTILA